MKLPDVARGPVRLFKIDYSPRLSEETAAFAATLCYDGTGCASVKNDGRGGANFIERGAVGQAVERAVDAYAKTLAPYHDQYGDLPMSGDFLVSLLLDEAIAAHKTRRPKR